MDGVGDEEQHVIVDALKDCLSLTTGMTQRLCNSLKKHASGLCVTARKGQWYPDVGRVHSSCFVAPKNGY